MSTKSGVGNAINEKPFDVVKMKNGDSLELIHGEHPHSKQDNTVYARTKDGTIYDFDGYRRPFKIEIEEYNYLKSSGFSGDEIRKGCSIKVFCDGVQVFDEFHRNYEHGYRIANQFILDMELNWGWFPKNVDEKIGKTIGYREQLFKIKSFLISQSCMIISTIDDKPRKKFLWEDEEDVEDEIELKVEITSPHITWYPKF
jgi:hypothetical protein